MWLRFQRRKGPRTQRFGGRGPHAAQDQRAELYLAGVGGHGGRGRAGRKRIAIAGRSAPEGDGPGSISRH